MPQNRILKIPTVNKLSEVRTAIVQLNKLINDVSAMQQAALTDDFIGWYGLGANSGTTPMKIGSTDTRVATAAMVLNVAGVRAIKAADAAGTTFGSLGTIPASTWGIVAIDGVLAGTITYVSGAANYTTGYATEALAIAALPARTTLKSRVGYLTVLASASTFVFATDALAGGSSGNPATTTNYYPAAGIMAPTGTALNSNGIVSLGLSGSPTPTFHPAWIGGKNGVLQGTTLTVGSTDTRISNSVACTYNANGLSNIPKTATAAGTALVAGTIPPNQWGIYGVMIDAAGAITYVVGPSNYTTGYALESQAIGDLGNMFPAAGLCFLGYVTVKTAVGLAWIAGTDAFAPGTTGNEASYTNYYSTPSVTLSTGVSAAQIADATGGIVL